MADIGRRNFNKVIGTAVVVPLTSLTANRMAHGADMVDPESAIAKGLQFVLVSDKEEMHCGKCNFYSASDDDKGKCIIFNGGNVPAEGWCTAFQVKK